MIVVKVGGSLYDHPRLGPGLRAYLESLAEPVLFVPGGGPFADAVRELDRIHGLGEETCHWLAIHALSMAGRFLASLFWKEHLAGHGNFEASGSTVFDCFPFCVQDEQFPERLPHSWDVTSDSIAARIAVFFSASRLILLKSVDVIPKTSWSEAASHGWVDSYFPHLAADAPFPIDVVNFRKYLDSLETPG